MTNPLEYDWQAAEALEAANHAQSLVSSVMIVQAFAARNPAAIRGELDSLAEASDRLAELVAKLRGD